MGGKVLWAMGTFFKYKEIRILFVLQISKLNITLIFSNLVRLIFPKS